MKLEIPSALEPFLAAWSVLVGLAVGSFANVVVARVPAGESVVSPRSRCPRCKAPIRWYDNLPVVSWLALRARCRSCGARISVRYPAVELAGAAVALIALARHGASLAALAEFGFVVTLLILALIDADTWLLPNAITWPLLGSGLLLGAVGLTPAGSFRPALYGAGLGFGAFALLAWGAEKALRKEALGFGDVWLLAALGAWMGVAALLPVVLLASLQGSVVGVALMALGKAQPGGEPRADGWTPPRNAVPFGPFLVAGALEWLWLGDRLARAVPVLRLFR